MSHASLPLPLKPLYGYLLDVPHKDKVAAERIVAHLADWPWDVKADGEPGEDYMGEGNWMEREGLPAKGALKGSVVVVRPALLTDGECYADKIEAKGKDKAPYRVNEGDLKGSYTISRKDVAHFVVEGVVKKWDDMEGQMY